MLFLPQRDDIHVSTHASVRRRHPLSMETNTPEGVSTHASVRRRQAGVLSILFTGEVSTHASVRRRPSRVARCETTKRFQLTPP